MNGHALDSTAIDRVLVIIPTYNEAENIRGIVARLRRSVPSAHVLIADDNSPDGTGIVADELATHDDHIHVMHRAAKQGLAAAYIAGFQWGLDHGYDALVEMDADGSHRPELLPNLLRALQDADMVKGSRWVTGGRTDQEWYRELLSRGANIWIQMAMDLPVRDSTGGYNAFRASILRRIGLHNIESKGYTFQVDMTRHVIAVGGKVVEVPIYFPDREKGVSKMSGNIIAEALLRTAGWGAQIRWNQLKNLPALIAGRDFPKWKESTIKEEWEMTDHLNSEANLMAHGGGCGCGGHKQQQQPGGCGCGCAGDHAQGQCECGKAACDCDCGKHEPKPANTGCGCGH